MYIVHTCMYCTYMYMLIPNSNLSTWNIYVCMFQHISCCTFKPYHAHMKRCCHTRIVTAWRYEICTSTCMPICIAHTCDGYLVWCMHGFWTTCTLPSHQTLDYACCVLEVPRTLHHTLYIVLVRSSCFANLKSTCTVHVCVWDFSPVYTHKLA